MHAVIPVMRERSRPELLARKGPNTMVPITNCSRLEDVAEAVTNDSVETESGITPNSGINPIDRVMLGGHLEDEATVRRR